MARGVSPLQRPLQADLNAYRAPVGRPHTRAGPPGRCRSHALARAARIGRHGRATRPRG